MSALDITEPQTDGPACACTCDCQREKAQLRENIIDLKGQLAALDRMIEAQRERIKDLEWTEKALQIPKKYASPSTRIALAQLRKTAQDWQSRGKTGLQNFNDKILANQMGVDPRTAGEALREAEQLGVLRLETESNGKTGAAKRNVHKVEFLPAIHDDPLSLTRPEERDPNGKRCGCNAGTFTEVAKQERTVRYTTIQTRCKKCGRVHSTRVVDMQKGRPRLIQPTQRFDTEEEAHTALGIAGQTPENEASCWSSNSDEGAPDEESYQSGIVREHSEWVQCDEVSTAPPPHLCPPDDPRTADVDNREHGDQPPAVLPVDADSIPEELKARPQWVCWRPEWDDKREGWTKVLINPHTGGRACVDKPDTWGGFAQAMTVYQRPGSELVGVGYVFSLGDPFTGVDCDKCRDPQTGELVEGARQLVFALNSYTEWSASAEGVHVIVEADKPGDRCVGRVGGLKVEMYSHGRWFAFTGHRVPSTPVVIEKRQKELANVYYIVFPERAPIEARPLAMVTRTDADVIDRAFRSKSGDKIRRLWSGDVSDYRYNGESGHHSADLALCRHLAYWTGGDAAQVDRLFRQSGLYRPKWDVVHYSDGRTYGQATIDKAMSS